jgi:DNA-binding XRE family transcriptional regulator
VTATQVYRLYARSGALLYVGISLNAIARVAAHSTAPWFRSVVAVTIRNHPTRAAAERAERLAVIQENPQYNVQHAGQALPTDKRRADIARRLRAERARMKLTQAELAQRCGVSRLSQHRFENGLRCPDAAYLSRFAQVGDVGFVLTGHRSDTRRSDTARRRRRNS